MIGINNLTTTSVNEEFLQKIARKVLKGEGVKGEIELSIALVESGRIREINKRYRSKNRVTDVLSFPETQVLGEKIQNLGEIIICLQQVKKNAKKFGSTFKKELAKILIHGILSLLGYHHKEGEKEEKERNYFSQII